jgi:hypothetical protein
MRRFIPAGAAALAVSIAASTGVAHAAATPGPACIQPTTQAFAASGDPNFYFLAPGGNFEGGAPGWTLAGGAGLQAGNNTAGGDPVSNMTSLSLPAGSSATSPPVCVGADAPSMRFFVRNTGAASSRLGVTALFTLPNGEQGSLLVASISGTGTWAATPTVYYLANLLALVSPTATTNVAFRLAPLDSTGRWSVDDVYVDPLKHR